MNKDCHENLNEEMENGTYEVIKKRLLTQGNELKEKVEKLNEERKEVFGSIETKILGSERIITEHNCIPRDMAPVEDYFIFGYNVVIGLKSQVELSDVFSIYKYENKNFVKQSLELINNSDFINDFYELYKYYKNTFFAKFTITEPYFYMIFQTGKSPEDIKVFKWAIEGNKLIYVDGRSEHEVKFKSKNEFKFIKATRDDQRVGFHPHVSILDKVFVETLEGDLTIKVEDNTSTGKGIYSEPVDDMDQTLDDAEIYYADLEQLIILKIKPYKENDFRYFIFNNKLKNVVRIDSIKDTSILLPGHHGVIFPKGYYLQSGEYKIFDIEEEYLVFDEVIKSSNGEDFQYIFYSTYSGVYLIYSYNIIEQKIDTPIICSGYSHFSSGEMIVFKHENEPRKNHTIQIWQTPYVGRNYVREGNTDSILFKIGNKDIVNAMADCSGVCKLISKGEGYQSIYFDIVKECERVTDSYFWLDKDEVNNIKESLKVVKESATFAIGEFDKVTRIKKSTKTAVEEVSKKCEELLNNLKYGSFDNIDNYVKALATIRNLRGEIAALKELRYVDLNRVEALDKDVFEKYNDFSQKCVEFLVAPEGLRPYEERVSDLGDEIIKVEKSQEGKELIKRMDSTSKDLELLIDIISNFKIEDPTMTTSIIEKISSLFSLINNGKARLSKKLEELTKGEMATQFNAQLKLLSQSVVNYLDICDSVDKCDEYLNKLMISVEELEGKFAEFEEYVIQLSEKREEVYNAFENKKEAILEKINKRLMGLFSSAERILSGIENRLKSFSTVEEITGYLATDIMVEKVRDVIVSLNELGDTVKGDEVTSKLKKVKEEAVRQLKDRQELYINGEDVIKFGRHHFSVNKKAVDLSIVQKDEGLYYHITGTDFWEKVQLEDLYRYKEIFNQSILSENSEVYRGEYLAYEILNLPTSEELYLMSEGQLLEFVQRFMEPRYVEGYTKGVHDRDATKILKALLDLKNNLDLLIYDYEPRAIGRLFWNFLMKKEDKELIKSRLQKLAKVSLFFSKAPNLQDYIPLLCEKILNEEVIMRIFSEGAIYDACEYLALEIMKGGDFVVSKEGKELYDTFLQDLRNRGLEEEFKRTIEEDSSDVEGKFYFIRQCLSVFIESSNLNGLEEIIPEVTLMLLDTKNSLGRVIYMDSKVKLEGLIGTHKVLEGGEYHLCYTDFMSKIKLFKETNVVLYKEFNEIKKDLINSFKEKIHLEDYKPQVLTSFVRNQLIDKVYLPLIGDNFAKQIGVVGEDKRTDSMGLLLLLSPPGYGKTTLMEYIASRLGLILVKVNGPALGYDVTSLDPDKAGNSAASEELKKLNVALKMGNNVMIYLDDIQHCNPEFLQKFISLCDGQRKIEGVYNGAPESFDLRGKKVAVVMAGNPYTESGEKFKIPDMLANRADVYNLGDMLMENEEAFKLSYIENALTSNPSLSKLSNSNPKDLYGLVELAKGADREAVNLECNYSVDELNEYERVLQKLFKVQDVVLKINMEYIKSAAQAEEYRNEPAFKLQGSYRNMNKIAEKVLPIMNKEELDQRILLSYENDAQTLTTGAEANMLKWKEVVGCISKEEEKRYEEIKEIFIKNKLVKGDDKLGQTVMVLSELSSHMEGIKKVLGKK